MMTTPEKDQRSYIALTMCWERNLLTFPSIMNLISSLSENEYYVDLFLPNSAIPEERFSKSLHLIPYSGKIDLLNKLLRMAKSRGYRVLISFYADDFIIASLIGMVHKIPVIYHNLEVFGDDEIKSINYKIKKILEIYFHKKVASTVIQDENRLNLLCKTNKVSPDNIIILPNSYIGEHKDKGVYLRNKFNISDNKTILLYVGGIEKWALDENLFKAVEKWPDNLVLALHGWSSDGFLQSLKPLIEKSSGKIFVNNSILCEEEYCELVSSADIGLVWYKNKLTQNVSNIGLSSGKLAQFLRCGIPVVVPEYLNDLKEIITRYHCGEIAENEDDIHLCAQKIINNYEYYRTNAFDYFRNYLDYSIHFKNFLERLHEIA